jgi:hypothetical protein
VIGLYRRAVGSCFDESYQSFPTEQDICESHRADAGLL